MKKELSEEVELSLRFSDTDAMGVIWHGNYLKFFEDAREAFGNKFGLTYLDVYKAGFFTPIVKSDIDYKSPIYYGEKASVIVKYTPVPAAKIIFEYMVMNKTTNKICAIGKTIQVFINEKSRILELNKPDFYSEWEKKHQLF